MVRWVYGNSGAGKTTLARELGGVLLDSDEIRGCLDFFDLTKEGRIKFNLAVAKLARVLSNQGHDVVVATICPYRELRKQVQEITECRFIYLPVEGDDCRKEYPFER